MTKILLVEDDKSLREIYGVRLLAEGYDIISAGDGEQALAFAIKDRPALIISDVMMPKISGFDMLDILRSTTETRSIKVIMMTALSSDDQRQRGESLGADRYLVKSQVGIEDVVRTVHDVLGDTAAPAQQIPEPTVNAQTRQPDGTPPVAIVPPRESVVAVQSPAFAPVAAANVAAQPQIPVAPQVTAMPSQMPVQPTPIGYAQPQPQPQIPLPQPTAPFSTPRPSGTSNRVIEPLEHTVDANTVPVADQIAQELSGQTQPAPAPAPMPAGTTEQTPPITSPVA